MKLSSTQLERYKRNLILPEVGNEGQKRLLGARVLVCGAGGLGSTVIVNLAALGAGTIGLVDGDIVEPSNLNRQFIHKNFSIGSEKVDSARVWIENFNPEIKVETYNTRLDDKNYPEITKNYDILADCTDSFKSKFLLNDISIETQKPLVHAGVTGFNGQVMTIIPGLTPCLRCVLGNLTDEDLETYTPKGVVSPAVSLAGSIQSMEILKLILNQDKALEGLAGKMLTFNAYTMKFKTLDIKRFNKCKCSKIQHP